MKEKLGLTNPKAILGGEEEVDDFLKLKERVTSHLATSDYQWIRPNMWQAVFGGSTNKRIHA